LPAGLTRYGNDLQNGLLEADYIVVEMANQILGEDWLPSSMWQVCKCQRTGHRARAGCPDILQPVQT
jgi:hypothetical protein